MDTFKVFDHGFVDNVLTLLITDFKFMQDYHQVLSPDLFTDGIRSLLASIAISFYKESGCVARSLYTTAVSEYAANNKMSTEKTSLLVEKAAALFRADANADYVSKRLDKFFLLSKAKILRHELTMAIESSDLGKIDAALRRAQTDFKKDESRPVDYFDTIDKRILRRVVESSVDEGVDLMIPTFTAKGIYPHRREITLCIAPSKRGKSIFLSHSAMCSVLQGHNTLHVSLENPLAMVEDRYDAMFSEIEISELQKQADILGIRMRYVKEFFRSKLYIIWRMARTYSPMDLKQDIIQMRKEGKRIDTVIVDYAELMRSSIRAGGDGWMRAARDDIFMTLRGIASELDFTCITAQQTPTKKRKNFRIYMEDGQESSMPAQHSSLIITLNQTEDEEKSDEMRLYVDGYWHGPCGHRVGDILLKQDFAKMQFCLREMPLADGVSYSQQSSNP